MSCGNCDGNDIVTFNWTLVSNSGDTTMDLVDPNSYMTIASDGSLVVDTRGLWPILTVEAYAFVFRGRHNFTP